MVEETVTQTKQTKPLNQQEQLSSLLEEDITKHRSFIREEKCQVPLCVLMKAKPTFPPLGNKGKSFG